MEIKIFKTKKKLKKENFQPDPNLYWKILLYIMFLLILGSFAFGFYFFMQTNEEMNLLDENIDKQTDLVQQDKIERVLEYFSEREKKSIEIIKLPSPLIDPSL